MHHQNSSRTSGRPGAFRRFRWLPIILVGILLLFLSPSARAEGKTLRVAFTQSQGYSYWDKNGEPAGVLVDYLDEISKYTDWNYEYVPCATQEMMWRFRAGEFDLLPYWEEQEEQQLTHSAYPAGHVQMVLLARQGDERIRSDVLQDLSGKRIGYCDRDTDYVDQLEHYLKLNLVTDYTLVAYPHYYQSHNHDIYEKLRSGEVDVLLDRISDFRDQFREVGSFQGFPIYLAVQAGHANLLELLNEALFGIQDSDPGFEKRCVLRHYPDAGSGQVSLTWEEKAYIQKKRSITVAALTDFLPLCSNESEQPGMAPEILKQISRLTGLTITLRYVDSYNAALSLLDKGQADVVAVCLENTLINIDHAYSLTRSYAKIRTNMLRNKTVNIDHVGGLRYAVAENQSARRIFPGDEFVYYSTLEQVLQAINRGKADYTVMLAPRAEQLMQSMLLPNVTSTTWNAEGTDACFALRTDRSTVPLLTILNKGIDSFSQLELDDMLVRNSQVAVQKAPTILNLVYAYPVLSFCLLGFAFLLLVVLAFLRSRSIREHSQRVHAEAANRAKSMFLSQMSHEIRTPLNGVSGMVQLARRYSDEPERVEHYLDQIQLSSQHLQALVNDILDMSKIENGSMTIHNEIFSLGSLLQTLSAVFVPTAQERNLNFQIQPNGILPEYVQGDFLRSKQIITNLLSNAMKFTEPGGSVTLRITASPREDFMTITFEVEDTGCGIAPENLERIFQPFEQEYTGTSRRYGGTGLGLSICRQLCQLMGGDIQVASTPGAGSRFRVWIPYKRQDEVVEPCGDGRRVLLVVSNPQELETFRVPLDMEHFRWKSAGNLKEAGHLLEEADREGDPFLLCMLADSLGGLAPENLHYLQTAHPPMLLICGYHQSILDTLSASLKIDSCCYPLFHKDLQELCRRLEGRTATRQAENIHALEGKRVLVVEDNFINMEVVCDLLDSIGASCEQAWNGAEGVEAVAGKPQGYYDLVLMDMQMPVMDGLTATRKIRAMEKARAGELLIFAMTANAFAEDVENCRNAGMDAHISKPFELEVLERTYWEFSRGKDNG